MTRNDTSNKPWISNYPPLQDWLNKIDARCQDQIPVGGPVEPIAYLEKWGTPNGRVFIVEVRANKMGWNIYTSTDDGTIQGTLQDAESRLGLNHVAGP